MLNFPPQLEIVRKRFSPSLRDFGARGGTGRGDALKYSSFLENAPFLDPLAPKLRGEGTRSRPPHAAARFQK